jgi:hypothetical protein
LRSKTLFEGLTPHFFRKNIGHTTAANEFIKSTANRVVGRLRDSEEGDILSEELMKSPALDTAITSAPSAKPSPVEMTTNLLANHAATRSLS